MANIKQLIDDRIRELKVTSLDISFNELADMYQSEELIIQPEYQRTFRWDIGKQSRFIESLLMEMPVPSIYVIELDDGKYELIDGLQRISSYLSYRGFLNIIPDEKTTLDGDQDEDIQEDVFEDETNEMQLTSGFALNGCDIIPELNGLTYGDLQAAMQIKLKRAYVRLEVLRKGINPEMKYHMFKRLNTGGEKLSPQEIRNCTIRLIDSKFINFIKDLKTDSHFRNTTNRIGNSKIKKRFDEELVLRFFAFKDSSNDYKHDIDEFLTNYMESVSLNDIKGESIFDYDLERQIFKKTFDFLDKAYGNTVFSTVNPKTKSPGVFNVYLFESITTGIQDRLNEISVDQHKISRFRDLLDDLKVNSEFRSATVGGGKNFASPMNIRFAKVKGMMDVLANEA